jgi:hypothetical protein
MATKKPKVTKKPKGPAKVTIDAQSANNLEGALRAGLTGSTAHILDDPSPSESQKKLKKPVKVELDARTVSRFVSYLKKTLIASGAYIGPDGDPKGPADLSKKKK